MWGVGYSVNFFELRNALLLSSPIPNRVEDRRDRGSSTTKKSVYFLMEVDPRVKTSQTGQARDDSR